MDKLSKIASIGCKVLHFSGHGSNKGLAFEKERSARGETMEWSKLSLLMRDYRDCNISMVFVSACTR